MTHYSIQFNTYLFSLVTIKNRHSSAILPIHVHIQLVHDHQKALDHGAVCMLQPHMVYIP
jgi:hypothetical protein